MANGNFSAVGRGINLESVHAHLRKHRKSEIVFTIYE
jgi:hypothetical protein